MNHPTYIVYYESGVWYARRTDNLHSDRKSGHGATPEDALSDLRTVDGAW